MRCASGAGAAAPAAAPNRSCAARACACSPSPYASSAATGPSTCAPRALASIRLERLTKSYTPSGEEKRAVPEVGSTWLGPAQ